MSTEPRFVYREPLKDKYPEISRVSEQLVRCIKCGLCRAVCPTLQETVSESQGARGRVSLVEAVFDGRLSLSDIFDDRISTCLNCKACVDACPSGVRVDDIILAARAELVSGGRFPFFKRLILRGLLKRGRLLPPVGKMASLLQRALIKLSPKGSALRLLLPALKIDPNRHLPVFAPRSFREQVSRRTASEPALEGGPLGLVSVTAGGQGLGDKDAHAPRRLRVAYFVGCTANLIYTNIASSTVDVLERLGVEVLVPPQQGCCGLPVFNSGDFATARGMAFKNLQELRAGNFDAIVVSCSSCGLALKREYSTLLGVDASAISGKVMDVSEFIVKKVGLEGLRVALEQNSDTSVRPASTGSEEDTSELVVTYHDPCHLNRGQGVRDEPRAIIRTLPGVRLREMRDADRCCGGAGLYSFTQYEMSKAIAVHKVAAIVEVGASLVLTGCASCIMQITDALVQAGHDIRVMHIVELLSLLLRGDKPSSSAREVLESALCSSR